MMKTSPVCELLLHLIDRKCEHIAKAHLESGIITGAEARKIRRENKDGLLGVEQSINYRLECLKPNEEGNFDFTFGHRHVIVPCSDMAAALLDHRKASSIEKALEELYKPYLDR